MSLKDKFDKLSKNQRIVGGLVLLFLFFIVASTCSAPAGAQFNPSLVGRGPEPVNLFQVTFKTTDGKRVGRGGQMAGLPPLGYVYRDQRGALYRVVGGEFGDTACSSTRCAVRATVFVAEN